jgi:hypothetical protein
MTQRHDFLFRWFDAVHEFRMRLSSPSASMNARTSVIDRVASAGLALRWIGPAVGRLKA